MVRPRSGSVCNFWMAAARVRLCQAGTEARGDPSGWIIATTRGFLPHFDILPALEGEDSCHLPSCSGHSSSGASGWDHLQSAKPTTRIELVTSPLPRGCSTTEPRGQTRWWAELDSNQRRRKPADLQSAPFNPSGIDPLIPVFHHSRRCCVSQTHSHCANCQPSQNRGVRVEAERGSPRAGYKGIGLGLGTFQDKLNKELDIV